MRKRLLPDCRPENKWWRENPEHNRLWRSMRSARCRYFLASEFFFSLKATPASSSGNRLSAGRKLTAAEKCETCLVPFFQMSQGDAVLVLVFRGAYWLGLEHVNQFRPAFSFEEIVGRVASLGESAMSGTNQIESESGRNAASLRHGHRVTPHLGSASKSSAAQHSILFQMRTLHLKQLLLRRIIHRRCSRVDPLPPPPHNAVRSAR